MSDIKQVVRDLQSQRRRTEQELEKLNLAIKALTSLDGSAFVTMTGRRKRTLSAAARAKIAAAQRARWSRLRKAKS